MLVLQQPAKRRPRGPSFRQEEDEFLRKHYRAKGGAWCADRLEGRTVQSVRKRAQYLGICHNKAESPPTSNMIDAVITRAYTGERKPGFASRCALQIGRSRDWVIRRALELGLLREDDQRPWTHEEINFASARPLTSPTELSRQMRRRGWRRTPSAIAGMRAVDRIERIDAARFTAQGLAEAFGVNVKTVTQQWIGRDLLKAEKRGWDRGASQGGDGWVIHEADVARFVIQNPALISFGRLEPNKTWFIDLMARYARTVGATGRQGFNEHSSREAA